jgi:hypothetical protein
MSEAEPAVECAPTALRGAIDMHAHSSPDVVERSQTDLQLARSCAAAQMAAVVLKNHHGPTAGRAAVAEEAVGGDLRVFGGLVLNSTATGGLNPQAVRVNLDMGAQVVWLPTVSAENHQAYLRRAGHGGHVGTLSVGAETVPVLDDSGNVLPALVDILHMVADHGAVLASGHISPREAVIVFERAREVGVTRLLVNHVEAPIVDADRQRQRDLAALGAKLEHCHLSLHDGYAAAEMLDAVRTVGIQSAVLSTDLGQHANPPPTQGFLHMHLMLTNAGLTEAEWRQMTATNPGELLGLPR